MAWALKPRASYFLFPACRARGNHFLVGIPATRSIATFNLRCRVRTANSVSSLPLVRERHCVAAAREGSVFVVQRSQVGHLLVTFRQSKSDNNAERVQTNQSVGTRCSPMSTPRSYPTCSSLTPLGLSRANFVV
jgi:hypothetical protein